MIGSYLFKKNLFLDSIFLNFIDDVAIRRAKILVLCVDICTSFTYQPWKPPSESAISFPWDIKSTMRKICSAPQQSVVAIAVPHAEYCKGWNQNGLLRRVSFILPFMQEFLQQYVAGPCTIPWQWQCRNERI